MIFIRRKWAIKAESVKNNSVPSGASVSASTIGKKFLVAITGLISFGYVVGHMLGNLQIFAGPDQINGYAAGLKSLGPMLWFIRAGLLAAFLTHIHLGMQLKMRSMAARPIEYQKKSTVKATWSSRTMIFSGSTILAFVIYHILHFTTHVTNPEFSQLVDSLDRPDVYSMVIIGFTNVIVSAFYILAILLLSIHLSHGISSMFQSLGIANDNSRIWTESISRILSIVVFLGFIAVPLGVLFGFLKVTTGGM